MNLLLFFFAIIFSFVAVRIGAVAFQLTGLEWSLSKFQALSCFTGTGFTTRESELIVGNLKRRKIATVLIILGNAGFIALIATLANSIRAPSYLSEFEIPYIHLIVSNKYFPWFNLALILLFLFLGNLLVAKTGLADFITRRVRNRMAKGSKIKKVSFEEIVIATGGYGLLNVAIEEGNPLIGKTIIESGLRKKGILVLMIERTGQSIAVPQLDDQIKLNDNLVCFGQIENIKQTIGT